MFWLCTYHLTFSQVTTLLILIKIVLLSQFSIKLLEICFIVAVFLLIFKFSFHGFLCLWHWRHLNRRSSWSSNLSDCWFSNKWLVIAQFLLGIVVEIGNRYLLCKLCHEKRFILKFFLLFLGKFLKLFHNLQHTNIYMLDFHQLED